MGGQSQGRLQIPRSCSLGLLLGRAIHFFHCVLGFFHHLLRRKWGSGGAKGVR